MSADITIGLKKYVRTFTEVLPGTYSSIRGRAKPVSRESTRASKDDSPGAATAAALSNGRQAAASSAQASTYFFLVGI